MNITYYAIKRQTGTTMLLSFDDVPLVGTVLTMTNGYYDEDFKAESIEKFVDSDGKEFVKVIYKGNETGHTKAIFFKVKRADASKRVR